jgi:hypothetical protein
MYWRVCCADPPRVTNRITSIHGKTHEKAGSTIAIHRDNQTIQLLGIHEYVHLHRTMA